jgi:hypothetical protein
VFADFNSGRIFSVAITAVGDGEATASDFREHTAEVHAGFNTGNISSFGVAANNELYVVAYGGAIVLVTPRPPPSPLLHIDTPGTGQAVRQPFALQGWALDANAQTVGVAPIHVWAYPQGGGAPVFVGVPAVMNRPDVAAFFGPQFMEAGFTLNVKGLAPGNWQLVVYGFVIAHGGFTLARAVPVTIQASGLMSIDTPAQSATVTRPFFIGGWALDPAALIGTGVDTIHVWAFRVAPATGPPVFLGVPQFGNRPDVAAIFGQQFLNSGVGLVVNSGTLPAGTWDITAFGHSSVSGVFDFARTVRLTVQ